MNQSDTSLREKDNKLKTRGSPLNTPSWNKIITVFILDDTKALEQVPFLGM